ncbi:MAG TPA: TadE/TadG family type IV pilus assembly protein [Novosphingobium sp.]|nr:TadE/TadG family type IV pilus assembly protein [Aeromicrobium sp.]HKX78442.1 TadE/TadG family type IV pilus assembly protein [Novosphingobium sp.]
MARPARILATARRLPREERGAAAIEFALAAPVFLMMIMGIFDIGHMAYSKAVLSGAVQEAARTSAMEGADTAEADEKVMDVVGPVIPGVEIESTRTSYFDFTDIGRPEKWNDSNKDGECDGGETYTDENGNSQWDADIGRGGNGGSGDVVLYHVEMTYKPLFPIPLMTDRGGTRTLSATAVKKNQPFGTQEGYGSKAGSCA